MGAYAYKQCTQGFNEDTLKTHLRSVSRETDWSDVWVGRKVHGILESEHGVVIVSGAVIVVRMVHNLVNAGSDVSCLCVSVVFVFSQ